MALRGWAELIGLAVEVGVVTLGESVSSAKELAERSSQRMDSCREFVGEGL